MIKLKNVINKHKSNKIKENSNTVRHLNNGTDHRHSKSCCDQSSPARRTITDWEHVQCSLLSTWTCSLCVLGAQRKTSIFSCEQQWLQGTCNKTRPGERFRHPNCTLNAWRIHQVFCMCSLFTGEYWYSSLCTENTQRTRPCTQERTPAGVLNLLHFGIRKSVLGMSKLFRVRVLPFKSVWFSRFSSHWRQLQSWYLPWNHDGYWGGPNELSLVSVMVARKNVLILFMELKDLSAVAVVTGIVKRTVRMKEMSG